MGDSESLSPPRRFTRKEVRRRRSSPQIGEVLSWHPLSSVRPDLLSLGQEVCGTLILSPVALAILAAKLSAGLDRHGHGVAPGHRSGRDALERVLTLLFPARLPAVAIHFSYLLYRKSRAPRLE
jgi:hypothetical protein